MSDAAIIEPRPIPMNTGGRGSVQYHEYTCTKCGKFASNTYCEPHRTRMLANRTCFTCNYWDEFVEENEPKKGKLTIIGGHVYGPGDRTSGNFRGMAGRRFDIEYIEPSVYAGQKITTFDLWSGSTLPEAVRPLFPDTARFLGGAERCQVGETGCWNPSDHQSEPYPLPRTLKPTARMEA